MAPSRICTRNSASTSQKYLAVALIDGVMRTMASGSVAGSAGVSSGAPCVTAWCQPSNAMPAIRNSTLKADHRYVLAGGRLPISGSLGQLLV